MPRGAWLPRTRGHADNYPYDLDWGERYLRFKTGEEKWPYPPTIGAVNYIMPQLDGLVLAWYKAPPISGPNTAPFYNLQNQILNGLTKQGG